MAGGSTLVAAFSCGESDPSGSPVGVARSAVTSAEFSIACEPAQAVSVATQGNIALVSWVSGNQLHVTRFDSEGNVLDSAGPTNVSPVPPPTGWSCSPLIQSAAHVARHAGSFSLVDLLYYDCSLSLFGYLRYRDIDTAGTVAPDWTTIFDDSGTPFHGLQMPVWAVDDDGTDTYVVYGYGSPSSGDLSIFHVATLDAGQVFVTASPTIGGESAHWGGFGCRTGSCFMTWQEPALSSALKAQVIAGAPSFSVTPTSPFRGPIAGTPSGFVQVDSDSARAFVSGTVDGPVALGVTADFQAAVHDGVATRVVLHDAAGVWSGTLADDATIATPITNEIPGWSDDLAVASFGGGRSVIVHAGPTGVTARFIRDVPASVPPGCSSGTGGGGGAGGATTSVVTVGVTVSASATTGVTTSAVSSSASGGGAGGATSTGAGDTTVGVTSSTAASSASGSGATTSGATTDAGVTSSGVGGAEANPEGGGCSFSASDGSNGNGVAWATTILGIAMATRSRRPRRAPIAAS